MDAKTRALLRANEWDVEHEDPLEIHHAPTDSVATKAAAEMVVSALQARENKEVNPAVTFKALLEVTEFVTQVVVEADQIERAGHRSADVWASAFNLIFNYSVSGRAFRLLKLLNHPLNYQDSNASHEADVRAFSRALATKVGQLRPYFKK